MCGTYLDLDFKCEKEQSFMTFETTEILTMTGYVI